MASAATLNIVDSARWFHALSDETRLEIIDHLLDGERCVCDLTDALDVAQSRLSFHLKVLKDAELVTDRRDGRWVYYTLNRDTIESIESVLGTLHHASRPTKKRIACCD